MADLNLSLANEASSDRVWSMRLQRNIFISNSTNEWLDEEDVYLADLSPVQGSEQGGVRPSSHNSKWYLVII